MALLIPAVALAGLCFLLYLVVTEGRTLERAAQRYRELEDEGIEGMRLDDSMPEFASRVATVILPDGSEADAPTLLREELHALRRYQEGRGGEAVERGGRAAAP